MEIPTRSTAQAETEQLAPHRPELFGLHFQTDGEQEQHDTELRDVLQLINSIESDRPVGLGTYQHPRDDEANHRSETEAVEQRHADRRRTQDKHNHVEKIVEFHTPPFCREFRQASPSVPHWPARAGCSIPGWRTGAHHTKNKTLPALPRMGQLHALPDSTPVSRRRPYLKLRFRMLLPQKLLADHNRNAFQLARHAYFPFTTYFIKTSNINHFHFLASK